MHWVENHRDELVLVVLVIQADAKAHAEDGTVRNRLMGRLPA
jgi:hypothetical protein